MGHTARDAHGGAHGDEGVNGGGQGDKGTGGRKGLGAAVLLLVASASSLEAQTWRTVTSSRQLRGEAALAVNVTYAAGRLTLAPGAPGTLYRMDLRYDEDAFAPVRAFDPEAGTLRLGVRSVGRERGAVRVSLGDRRRGENLSTIAVALTPDIPLDLTVELGAAEADVDLGGLSLRSVHYRTGASESRLTFDRPNRVPCTTMRLEAGAATFRVSGIANAGCRQFTFTGGVGEVVLDFSGAWRGAMEASVRVSIGELTVRVPDDVGVALRLNRFLASFERAGFEKRGNMYYSANFAAARYRLTLDVHATIGGVNVEWIDR